MKTPNEYFESKNYKTEPNQRMIYLSMLDFAQEYAEYYHKQQSRQLIISTHNAMENLILGHVGVCHEELQKIVDDYLK